jgi:[ribosomal protein S18]-alanine N-acetyltransferase
VFKLRAYDRGDFEEIWRLDQICFAHGIAYTRPELRHFLLAQTAVTIVAEKERQIAGFLIADVEKHHGHIITIDIHPDHRRAGLGTQLMRAAEARMVKLGVRQIALEVAVDNMPAIAFYKRHGFTVLKTIPRYYHGELDALLMGKLIS